MGKSGDRLRAAKAEKKIYTFTRAQLEERDRCIAQEAIRQRESTLKRVVDEHAERIMQEYVTEEKVIDTYKVLLYALSVSCKVLIEKFGWTPTHKKIDRRMKIIRFTEGDEDELQEIRKYSDLKSYSEYVNERYGVAWISKDVEGGD